VSKIDAHVAMITSPLEEEHAARIAANLPSRVELIYRPDLFPPRRYVGDHNGPAGWKRPPEADDEWRELLARADITWNFARQDGLGPLELTPKIKWIQGTSAGVGQLVRNLGLQETEVIVTTASGVHADALAEFVAAVLLYNVKQFATIIARQREHHWRLHATDDLRGKSLVIVGYGRIGRRIAEVARALGMNVSAMVRPERAATSPDDGVEFFTHDRLDAQLAKAFAVVACVPHTDETENLFGAHEFAAMKPGAIFVNIARGVVVDESAMIEALNSGHLGFAALDVFRTEPLPADSPFWDMPNVLVSPHSASTSIAENGKIADLFIANMKCFVEGRFEDMSPVLDKLRLY
jgi:phosphoglycerate dehydrogenase-like enzyme